MAKRTKLIFKSAWLTSGLVLLTPFAGLSCWQKPQAIQAQKDRQLDPLLDILGNLTTQRMTEYPSQVARQNQIIGDLSELGVSQRTPTITGVVFRFRVVRIDDLKGEITLEAVVRKNQQVSRRLIYVSGFYSQNWDKLNQALEQINPELKTSWNHLKSSQVAEVGKIYQLEDLGVELEIPELINWSARIKVKQISEQTGQIEGNCLLTYAGVVGTLAVKISGFAI